MASHTFSPRGSLRLLLSALLLSPVGHGVKLSVGSERRMKGYKEASNIQHRLGRAKSVIRMCLLREKFLPPHKNKEVTRKRSSDRPASRDTPRFPPLSIKHEVNHTVRENTHTFIRKLSILNYYRFCCHLIWLDEGSGGLHGHVFFWVRILLISSVYFVRLWSTRRGTC